MPEEKERKMMIIKPYKKFLLIAFSKTHSFFNYLLFEIVVVE